MLRLSTFISLLLIGSNSLAIDLENKDDSACINAYVSQGWIKTSDNKVSGDSDSKFGSLDRLEIGAYGWKQFNQHFDFRALTKIFKDGTRSDTYEPKVIYFLGDFHKDLGVSVTGIRVGRVKHILGFYNQTRDNPAFRDTDILPQSIYRDTFRDMATSGDGIQAYLFYRDNSLVDLSLEVSDIKPVLFPREDVLAGFFGFGAPPGKFSDDSKVHGFNIGVTEKFGSWSARYDLTDMDYNYSAGTIDFFPSGKMNTKVHYIGFRKYFDNSDITIEQIKVKRTGSTWDFLLASDPSAVPVGYNFVYRYKSNSNITYTAGYNVWYYSNHDKDGKKMQALTGVPFHQAYSKDLNLGIKWSKNNWTIKGEVHHFNGTNILSTIENPNYGSNSKWNLISSSITYTF